MRQLVYSISVGGPLPAGMMNRSLTMKVMYNKLIRDGIPGIIEKQGNTCVTRVLSEEEYRVMVDAKLDEELAEYHKDQNVEELADLLEVIYAAAAARGHTARQLDQIREEKAAKRGRFEKKLLLLEVCDDSSEESTNGTC